MNNPVNMKYLTNFGPRIFSSHGWVFIVSHTFNALPSPLSEQVLCCNKDILLCGFHFIIMLHIIFKVVVFLHLRESNGGLKRLSSSHTDWDAIFSFSCRTKCIKLNLLFSGLSLTVCFLQPTLDDEEGKQWEIENSGGQELWKMSPHQRPEIYRRLFFSPSFSLSRLW